MRRAPLVILLLALTAWAPGTAAWAATSPATIRAILRDCEDDGSLSGSYRASELRDAVRNIGTDLDQYSDCRDVINAAVLRAVSGSNAPGAGATAGGGGSADGSTAGAGADGGAGTTGEGTPSAGADLGAGAVLTPESPEEAAELSRLRSAPPASPVVGNRPVEPGAAQSLAAILAHELPTPLIAALALLTLGALVAGLPATRRRLLDRRTA